ncbi:uncharacterized protein LOC144434642 [Glandiceps talaboti]
MAATSSATATLVVGFIYICILSTVATATCPTSCYCWDTNVDCRLGELTEIPSDIPFDTTNLYLGWNRLTYIRNDSFSALTNLVRLVLGANQIEELDVLSFAGLHNLEYLNLESNRLSTLQSSVFYNLTKLQHLHINHNKLSCLNDDLFDGLLNLDYLYLYSNQIHYLSEGIFRGLGKLRYLRLYTNSITSLPENIFEGLAELYDLRLHSNTIRTLSEGTFNGLSKLRTLYLYGNHITTLPGSIFNGLNNIYILRMYNNPWSCDCRLKDIRQWLDDNKDSLSLGSTIMRCEAPDQHAGKDMLSIPLDDLICYPLPVFYTPFKVIKSQEGVIVTLDCDVIGDPTPTKYWITPNGTVVEHDATPPEMCSESNLVQRNDGSLMIPFVNMDDEGIYTCVATSPEGTTLGSRNLKLNSTMTASSTVTYITTKSPTTQHFATEITVMSSTDAKSLTPEFVISTVSDSSTESTNSGSNASTLSGFVGFICGLLSGLVCVAIVIITRYYCNKRVETTESKDDSNDETLSQAFDNTIYVNDNNHRPWKSTQNKFGIVLDETQYDKNNPPPQTVSSHSIYENAAAIEAAESGYTPMSPGISQGKPSVYEEMNYNWQK